jgi:hypothetical protein
VTGSGYAEKLASPAIPSYSAEEVRYALRDRKLSSAFHWFLLILRFGGRSAVPLKTLVTVPQLPPLMNPSKYLTVCCEIVVP